MPSILPLHTIAHAFVFAFALAGGAALLEAPVKAQETAKTEVATFAGGCFWSIEKAFDGKPGVISAVSGFMGGTTKNPTYDQVVRGNTGHLESVQVTYDPAKISYEKLLDIYWHDIDPTTADGQFCDFGDQYRTAVFVHDDAQKRLAEASKTAVAAELDGKVDDRNPPGLGVHAGRRRASGLREEKPHPLQFLPDRLRARGAAEGGVGRQGAREDLSSARRRPPAPI